MSIIKQNPCSFFVFTHIFLLTTLPLSFSPLSIFVVLIRAYDTAAERLLKHIKLLSRNNHRDAFNRTVLRRRHVPPIFY